MHLLVHIHCIALAGLEISSFCLWLQGQRCASLLLTNFFLKQKGIEGIVFVMLTGTNLCIPKSCSAVTKYLRLSGNLFPISGRLGHSRWRDVWLSGKGCILQWSMLSFYMVESRRAGQPATARSWASFIRAAISESGRYPICSANTWLLERHYGSCTLTMWSL